MIPEVRAKIKHIQLRSISEGYKKTKVGVIPDVWHCYQIHECLSICNHERKPISEDVRKTIPGPYPYYGPTQAQGYIATYESEGPAVLIGEDGDHFLKYKDREMTMYVDGKYTVNNHAHVLRGTELCETKWFYYAYQHKSLFDAITRQGAGRYKLTKEALIKLPLQCPPIEEQRKIISILNTQDKVIELKEKHLAEKHRQKKYLMQQLLTGKKRLPGFSGEWKNIKLCEVLSERKEKNVEQNLRICSVAVQKGVVDQVEHLGRSYAANDTSNYSVAHYGDIIYTKSPTGDFLYGIVKQNLLQETVAVSPLYGVFTPLTFGLGYFLHTYFQSAICARNYLLPIVQKGAKNTINITNDTFISSKLYLPLDVEEQKAIADTFIAADREIDLLRQDIEQEKQKKKALMQLLLAGIVRVKI